MKKLSFVWFAAIATALFTLALGFVAFRFYNQRHDMVEFYEKEARGIVMLKEITEEIIHLSSPIKLVGARGTDLLGRLDREIFDKEIYGPINEAEVANFRTQVGRPQHNENVLRDLDALNKYRSFVLDKSNLILDPQFQAYHLVDALFVSLPKIFFLNNSLDQLQNDIRGPANRHPNDVKIWQEVGIKKAFLDNFSQSVDKVFDYQPEDPKLVPYREPMLRFKWDLINSATILFDSLSENQKTDSSDQVRRVREAALQALDQGVRGLKDLNQARLSAAKFGVYSSLLLAFVLWVVSLSVIFFLVRTFLSTSRVMENVITDQKKALASAQKLAMLGELTAGIGHDIANPLAVIQATTSVIEKHFGKEQPTIVPYLQRIYRMVERINAIIKSMKGFLTNDNGGPIGKVDLLAVFNDVKLLLNHRVKHFDIDLEIHIPHHLHQVVGNESEIIQLFVNLLSNSIDAVRGQKNPKIGIEIFEKEAYVFIQVKDNGPGIPVENRDKIFEPLFTTKEQGEGTGLGLAICQRIINKCHGKLELLVQDQEPGACFQIRLNIASV